VSLAEELLNLRRELAAAGSPLQRMQMLARSWRSVRQLSPAERKQLSKAVGAEGLEGVLDRIAARKGRVGASFLVPSLAKFKDMDPDALGRLIQALRDPEQRRQVLEKSASAVGDVLYEKPTEEPETEAEIEEQEELEAEVEAEADDDVEVDPAPAVAVEVEVEVEPPVEKPVPDLPSVSPVPALDAKPLPVRSPSPPPSLGSSAEFEQVTGAPTLVRRLALARAALDDGLGWSPDRLRALLDVFPQDWARRRILTEMLKRGLVEDTSQAIDLIGSLESRASRRWCVSLLLHQRELSEVERQALLGPILTS
jgi:hypothetical protein